MQKFVYALVFSMLLTAVPAWGQRITPVKTPSATVTLPATPPTIPAPPATVEKKTEPVMTTLSPGELKATPEMWFYEQYMKEYKDPKTAVRAKAEFDAQQRARRIASMRWFGFSNARPRVNPDPVHVYPPGWISNTPLQRNSWQGTGGQPYYIARPEPSESRTY
jgi:hypothetical protein